MRRFKARIEPDPPGMGVLTRNPEPRPPPPRNPHLPGMGVHGDWRTHLRTESALCIRQANHNPNPKLNPSDNPAALSSTPVLPSTLTLLARGYFSQSGAYRAVTPGAKAASTGRRLTLTLTLILILTLILTLTLTLTEAGVDTTARSPGSSAGARRWRCNRLFFSFVICAHV